MIIKDNIQRNITKHINVFTIKHMFVYLIIYNGLLFTSCSSKYSKEYHVGTGLIDTNLYRERFLVYSGGALANSSYSIYLTDSLNFRKYLGTVHYDDEQLFIKVSDSNEILVYRAKRNNENDTLEKKIYLLSDLKKGGKFD
jgi:hypothetical protein